MFLTSEQKATPMKSKKNLTRFTYETTAFQGWRLLEDAFFWEENHPGDAGGSRAGWCCGCAAHRRYSQVPGISMKPSSFRMRVGWRIFRRALASIWRIRSRVTWNWRPTSSRVRL